MSDNSGAKPPASFIRKTFNLLFLVAVGSLPTLVSHTADYHYDTHKYVKRSEPTSIIDHFANAADRLVQTNRQEKNGISSQNGWTCYPGKDLQIAFPSLYKELSSTETGRNAAQYIIGHKTDICVAPDPVFDQVSSHLSSGAYHDSSHNSLLFRQKFLVDNTFIHETTHARQSAATNGLLKRLYTTQHYTQGMQASLALEAGAVSKQAINSMEYVNCTPDGFTPFTISSESEPSAQLVRRIESLAKKNGATAQQREALINYFLHPKGEPPAFLIDDIAAHFLKNGSISTWVKYYTTYVASDYSNLEDKTKVDFAPMSFDMETVRKLVTGDVYPEGTEFPKTQKALNELGHKLEPFMTNAITTEKRNVEIGQMATDFASNLPQKPQRYRTAKKTNNKQSTPL